MIKSLEPFPEQKLAPIRNNLKIVSKYEFGLQSRK